MKDAGLEVPLLQQAKLTAVAAPVQANALVHGVRYESCWMRPNGAELAEVGGWVEEGKMEAGGG